MAVVWRTLLLALLVQKSIGQEFKQEDIQQAIHHVQNVLKAHKARRLAEQAIPDFAKMCASPCWHSVVDSMVTMYKALESDPACGMSGTDAECTPNRRLNSGEASTSPDVNSCMFDDCSPTGSIGMLCAALTDPTHTYHSYVVSSNCTRASLDWYCGSICGTACQADSVEERKLFCQPHDDTATDNTSSSQEAQTEDCGGGGGMDGDAMSDMFSFICSQNPAGEYCQAKGMQWVKNGAFGADAAELFPDVCAVDCNTPTGKAIKDLGCCMAGSMIGMQGAEQKAARAGVYACGGLEAMTFCGTAESLPIPQVMLVGGKGLAKCPTSEAESMLVQASIAVEIGVKKAAVSLIVCHATGSTCGSGSGRRLAEAANTMEYTVRVKGSKETIAAKKAAIETKMKTVETSSGGKSEVPAKGLQPQASKAGQNSLGLLLGMLVVSALFK